MCSPYAGGCEGWTLFAGGETLCALCMLEAAEGGLSFGVSKFQLWQFSHYSPPVPDRVPESRYRCSDVEVWRYWQRRARLTEVVGVES